MIGWLQRRRRAVDLREQARLRVWANDCDKTADEAGALSRAAREAGATEVAAFSAMMCSRERANAAEFRRIAAGR